MRQGGGVLVRHRLGSLASWVAVLGVLLAVAHRAGGALAGPDVTDPGSWSGWVGGRSAPTAAMAVLRLLALALGWYLLAVTAIGVVLRLVRAGQLVTVADVVTLPFVRSMVQAGLGLGVAGASVAAVASLATQPPRPPTVADLALGADHEPLVTLVAETAPVLRRLPEVAPPPVATEAPRWTVAPGDHLWSIAERTLAGAWQRTPAEAEVLPYWEQVVARNRASLADPANPDLLFPGQELVLPPPPPGP